jgi:hypothetical protein
MKTIIKIILVFLPLMGSIASTQDTIYVMRSGMVVYKKAITDIDSISFENSLFNRRSIVNNIAANKNYSVFYQGLVATGLVDSLKVDRDKSYDYHKYLNLLNPPFSQGSGSVDQLPIVRRYGFTVLMESDSVFIGQNIKNLSDLKNYAAIVYNSVYPEDAGITDVTNRRNSLNRFIAYHLINKKLSLPKFIDAYDTPHMIKTIDMYEYLEPMCPNTLIEIKKERSTGLTNLINQSAETGSAIHIIKVSTDKDVYNGFYYGIDKIMVYDLNVINQLSSKRLRFDMASLFPELTNNNMRGYLGDKATDTKSWDLPNGYLDRVKMTDGTVFTYLNSFGGFLDYQGDEAYFRNQYGFTITTLPVPTGTYEVRLCCQPTGGRGVAEVYVDSISVGPPLDYRISASSPEIGYVVPNTSNIDDPFGYENDKMMRNHGYMKGSASYKSYNGIFYGVTVARQSDRVLRKVLGTFSFSKAGNHKISVKGLMVGQFMIDYIEFVPVSALETEDIY